MLMAGRFIRQKNDPLQKINLERLYKGILQPKKAIQELIQQLRIVQTIDHNRYRQLKTQLPYIVTGIFHPPYRKTENFGSIEYFILDIDHLQEKEKDIDQLKEQLFKDERVMMIFKSPGNNGLKLIFKLKDKCYDASKYSLFYKSFVQKFSSQYQLDQVLDKATCDVTRACFVSWDAQALYRPDTKEVSIEEYINFDNLWEVREQEKALKTSKSQKSDNNIEKRILTDDLLQDIKQKLNPNTRRKPKKIIYVPEEMDQIIEQVQAHIMEHDILMKSITNIHYGKKVVFGFGPEKWAEINIFYGKKGISLVKSPKRGRDEELEDVVYQILCQGFYGKKTE